MSLRVPTSASLEKSAMTFRKYIFAISDLHVKFKNDERDSLCAVADVLVTRYFLVTLNIRRSIAAVDSPFCLDTKKG